MTDDVGPATEVSLRRRHRPRTLSNMTSERLVPASMRRKGMLALAIVVMSTSVAAASSVGPVAGVARHGACAGGPSNWRLRVTADGTGMLVVRFRLTGGGPAETWNLFLDQNGTGFFAGSRVSDENGLVRLRRPTADLSGEDVIRAAGHDVATGEICRGRVRI